MEENKKDLPVEQDRHIGGRDLQKEETAFIHGELFCDSCNIIEQSQASAYRSVNEVLVKRNWLLGKRIQQEVLKEQRAKYGVQVVVNLAKALTEKYGKGFTKTNLYHFVRFYQSWPNIFHTLCGKFDNTIDSIGSETPISLSWSHFRIILQEENSEARAWYAREAAKEMWGTRTLQRNISSQYYHRLLKSQNKELVQGEMKSLTKPLQDKLEYLKNPIVAEFLGFKNNTDYTESNLEQSIIDHLIPFLMELGKGFAFVDRQKHIHTDKEDYFIDLVFRYGEVKFNESNQIEALSNLYGEKLYLIAHQTTRF